VSACHPAGTVQSILLAVELVAAVVVVKRLDSTVEGLLKEDRLVAGLAGAVDVDAAEADAAEIGVVEADVVEADAVEVDVDTAVVE
jgi:hypothetical protein